MLDCVSLVQGSALEEWCVAFDVQVVSESEVMVLARVRGFVCRVIV